jgi:hypothetical protein
MDSALRALLSGVIDYAGLFPPAGLALEPAIRSYAAFRAGADAFMLGRFVIPATRLPELDPFAAELFPDDPGRPFRFAALGRGGADPVAFLAGLDADLAVMRAFEARHRGRVAVDVLETRLPLSVLDAAATLAGLLDAALPRIGAIRPFFEVPLAGDWRRGLDAAADVLGSVGGGAGFKLRTGGLEAAAFPSCEQVAAVLVACREAQVPFKATAGLHHPLPRRDETAQATMHGFLNVFGGGVLAFLRGLSEAQLAGILEQQDAAFFRFEDGHFRAGAWAVGADEIARARGEAVLSFGSCSFDEPREDLAALGLM